jgi:hypothetical protein
MPDKPARARAFWKFLQRPPPPHNNNNRQGVYSSALFADKVLVLLLDTRWHRHEYCIPSVANKVPFLGAGIACITRWLSAGLFPQMCNTNAQILGEEQWAWLEQQLIESTAQAHIVVSSIQVLTTNAAMESWGHFPNERDRLVRLLSAKPGVLLLSGDVHYAEILDPRAAFTVNDSQESQAAFLEVTSSGLTHDCSKPFYGRLCQPILDSFHLHRFNTTDNYYIGKNFGTIDIDYDIQTLEAHVHSAESGSIVLSTGPRPFAPIKWRESEFERVVPCMDGHLQRRGVWSAIVVLLLVGIFVFYKLASMVIGQTQKEKNL